MQFTKEQLISRINQQIDINSTIIERLCDDSAAVSELAVKTATLDIKILDIALASLEAEPVAYTEKCEISNMQATGLYLRGFPDNSQGRDIALYTAAPATVVPEESMEMFGIGSVFKPQIVSEVDCDNCAHYQPDICHGEGCPAAMQKGNDNG